MSLFDILRYSNTDVRSEDELAALPENLLHLFRIEAHIWYNENIVTRSIGSLVDIQNMSERDHAWVANGMAQWVTEDPAVPLQVFHRALRKYNPDESI